MKLASKGNGRLGGASVTEGIRCEVVEDDPDYLLVSVSASNNEFSGTAEAYISPDAPVELASKLEGFPASSSDARELMIGSFEVNSAGGAAKLRFFCSDRSGHSWVEVTIESGDPVVGLTQTALLVIPVEATGVDSFVSELRRLNAAGNRLATLNMVGRPHSSSLKYGDR